MSSPPQHKEVSLALNKQKSSEVEHPSDVIGGWGPVQRNIFIVLTIMYMVAPFQNAHIVFTAPKLDYFACVDNDPSTGQPLHLNNSCFIDKENDKKCSKFEYDKSQRTLTSEFDLICGKELLGSAAQSMHQIGYAISGVILGLISDRYGRFFCAKFAIALEIIAGFGQAYAPSIYVYMFARLFVGIAAYGRFLNGYVLIAEWVGPKMRGKMAAVHELFGWGVGKLALPWVFFFIRDYYIVQLSLSTVELFLFGIYILVIHESPKWLLTNGRYEEAEKILLKAAKAKGEYSSDEVKRRVQLLKEHSMKEKAKLEEERHSQASFLDVWKDPKLLKLSIILYYTWFSKSLIGSGSFFNIANLGGNLYLNVFIIGWSNVVSNLLLYILVRRMERRTLMIMSVVLQASFLLCTLGCSFHDTLLIPRIFFNFCASVVSNLLSDTLYVYTTETFPTTMRQVQIGTASVFSRFGSVVAPFIKDLTIATHLSVSLGLFVILAMINSIVLFVLPDTTDIQLPDNILQTKGVVESDIKRRRSSILSIHL